MQTLRDIGEQKLLDLLRERFQHTAEDLLKGIGDDSAVLKIDTSAVLISTDTMAEGIHFLPSLFTPYQIAYKLVVSNVSDIHAMGGKARWVLLNLSLPEDTEDEFLDNFLKGLQQGLNRYNLSLIGGDITGCDRAVFTITILGFGNKRIITREGARMGDRIYLTGPVGEAACGLELIKSIGHPVKIEEDESLELNIDWQHAKVVLERFLLPTLPSVPEPLDSITSMIDVSDGLFIDLWRLCRESNVGARLYEEQLPCSRALDRVATFLEIDPYSMIIAGGEDYQLLFTSSEELDNYYRIGEITKEGLSIVRTDGSEEAITPLGFQHFGT
ncbi:MAG: thiamine-phosphate kinase [Nitrospirae bacterium]|nr:thiamine-phosphate kinase [Nitrospirota bacterium]